MKIDSEVPFGHELHNWLLLNHLRLEQVAHHDSREAHYLAWENVRKERNPFFTEGTGFEGYLVGRCASPDAALEAVLAINQHILDAIARLYRFQPGLRNKLMKALMRENSDPALIAIWSAYLGAELGKLRAQMLSNKEAQAFQTGTYNIVRNLPPVVYHQLDNDLTQTYDIGSDHNGSHSKMIVSPQILKPSQQDAWRVAANIGEFGHPLVRRFIERA